MEATNDGHDNIHLSHPVKIKQGITESLGKKKKKEKRKVKAIYRKIYCNKNTWKSPGVPRLPLLCTCTRPSTWNWMFQEDDAHSHTQGICFSLSTINTKDVYMHLMPPASCSNTYWHTKPSHCSHIPKPFYSLYLTANVRMFHNWTASSWDTEFLVTSLKFVVLFYDDDTC